MKKLTLRKKITLALTLLLILIAIARITDLIIPKPKPDISYVTEYTDGKYVYSCNRAIETKLQDSLSPSTGPKRKFYIATNKTDVERYCHSIGPLQ